MLNVLVLKDIKNTGIKQRKRQVFKPPAGACAIAWGPKLEAIKKVIMDHVTKRVNVLTVQP